MDIVISAVASELVSRFISFLSDKQHSSRESLETLQRLLLRAHTIVEEAEGRYISNSRMLVQLKTLTEAMFRGYDVLDTYMPLEKLGETTKEEASGGFVYNMSWPLTASITRRRRSAIDRHRHRHRQVVESTAKNLETTVASMAELVVLLTGCERMSRTPYSSYLYMDSFMFGRLVEKQQVLSVLTKKPDDDDDDPSGSRAPTVLPVIGGCRVGKKTFVANICSDDRIRSCYPCILHLSGDEVVGQRAMIDQANKLRRQVRTLVTVEFVSDVTDEEWLGFYSLVAASTGRGSTVIIVSRLERLARFATVPHPTTRIGRLSREEYGYLFKALAFGSADPADHHPRLALLGRELATAFQGSLIMLNVYASVLRDNLNVGFWTRVLELFRATMRRNLAVFGEHPKALLERHGAAVDITEFSSLSLQPSSSLNVMNGGGGGASFRLVLLTAVGKEKKDASRNGARALPRMSFGDVIAGGKILPDEFQLVWKSRLPPHTVICANCAVEQQQQQPVPVVPPWRKRQRLIM